MDDLTYTLRQLCQRNRDGSHNTQADLPGVNYLGLSTSIILAGGSEA